MEGTGSLLIKSIQQPAVLVRDGKVLAFSPLARQLFPDIEEGETAARLLPETVIALETREQIAEGIWGECRMVETEDGRVYLFTSPEAETDEKMEFMSYYLRNQIATSMLAADRVEPKTPKENTYAAILRKSLYVLLRMADHMSFLASPLPQTDMRYIAIAKLVEELCSTTETYTGRTIHMTATDEDMLLWGDEALLKRMMLSLLSNAVKFAPEGTINVTVKKRGCRVTIVVQDPGNKKTPKNPWVLPELDASRGLGMGLEMARRIAVFHDGTLLREHYPRKGTCITVTLEDHPPKVFTLRDSGRICYRTELDPVLEELSDVVPWEKFKSMFED